MNVRELFETAIALPADARAAYLDMHCHDAAQRARIEGMLAADADHDTRLLDHSVDALFDRLGDASAEIALPSPGTHIGPFVLRDLLGQGGSSIVFRAERVQDGVTQIVALKLLRRGIYSEEERARFRRERHALAQLRHAGIARLIEGGITHAGVPYIALELVDGPSITDYVRMLHLDLRARLHLFMAACRAVEAAHRALIVHRDLKPSNVLVDNDGHVKLLDFGIAKLLDDEIDGEGTQTQHRAMTPAYAAPEQFAGGSTTTATDVYALGVLLGELATGARRAPGDVHTPSSRIDANSAPGVLPAAPKVIRRQLRGDLDNIVMKATASEPERRYASAGALAEDIERHLCGQPVSAHPPSRAYRARKFVQRHRGGVAMSLVVGIAVLMSLGIALWQAQIARAQALLAHDASVRANATRAFIVDLLKTASADLPKGERPSPQQLVDQAARDVHEDPDMPPRVRAQILLTLGSIARSNGDYARATQLFDETLQIHRQLGIEPDSDDWITANVEKGNLLHTTGHSDEADRMMAVLAPVLQKSDSEIALSGLMLHAATRAYAGDAERAATIAQQALSKAQRVFGADSINGISTATHLGQLCSTLGRYREAETILDDALARWRRLNHPQDQHYARSLFHLATAKQRLGKRDQVDALFREGIALMRRIYDGPHDRLASGLLRYGEFLTDVERFDAAQAAIDEALTTFRSLLGEHDVKTATALDAAGELARARNAPGTAEPLLRAAHATLQAHAQTAGYEPELASTRLHLAEALLDLGHLDEAAALQAEKFDALPAHPRQTLTIESLRIGSRIALARAQPQQALDDADHALALLNATAPPLASTSARLRAARARALLALNRNNEAAAEAAHAIEQLRTATPKSQLRLTSLLVLHARCEHAAGRPAAAAASVAQARALKVSLALLAPDDRALLESTTP